MGGGGGGGGLPRVGEEPPPPEGRKEPPPERREESPPEGREEPPPELGAASGAGIAEGREGEAVTTRVEEQARSYSERTAVGVAGVA